jgi:hypothetical protein
LAAWPGHFAERRKLQLIKPLRDPSSVKEDGARLATWTCSTGLIFRAKVQSLRDERRQSRNVVDN